MSLARLAAAFAFGAFVVGQSSHLVHHLFDAHETRDDCAFAAAAERLSGLPMAVEAPTAEQPSEPVAEAHRPAPPTNRALAPARPRAPPPLAS